MIHASHPTLAIALTEGQALCAEVSSSRGKATLRRAAAWAFPAGTSLDRPEEAGHAFKRFLQAEGFTATRAVIGVPARWVMAQSRELPPAGESEARAMLRLQAEKLAVSDPASLVFDYAGETRADRPSRVLVLAMLRDRVAQVQRLAEAASLRLQALVPTSLALADAAHAAGSADRPLVWLTQGGAEVVWRSGGEVRQLQHVPLPLNGHGPSLGLIGSELRRGAALWGGGQREAAVFDSLALDPDEVQRLGQEAGVRLTTQGLPEEAASVEPRLAPVVALALSVGRGRPLPVDFIRPRLAEPKPRRVGRWTVWAAVLGLLLVGLVVSEVVAYRQGQAELASLQAQADRLAPDAEAAEASLARFAFGRGFFEGRPAVLECLRGLTLAFTADEPVWAINFTLRADGRGQITGGAADQRAVLALLDRLKSRPGFQNVQLVDFRTAAGAADGEIAFSIAFHYERTG